MTSAGLTVAGTGTDVGKTVVAGLMLRWLRGLGVNAVPMKPVQTGATRNANGDLVAPDLEAIMAAAALVPELWERDLMAPFLYEPACSPHLAGRMAGAAPTVATILRMAETLLQRRQFLLVELAGGVMVPLNDEETNLTLVKELGFPTLVVGHAGLGTINHTLLTLQALERAEVEVVGVVLNHVQPAGDEAWLVEENVAAIERWGRVPVIGVLPHGTDHSTDDLSGLAALQIRMGIE